MVLSAVFGTLGLSADHPITGETFEVINLLTKEGLYDILTKMVKNFTAFAPLGIVIVAMLVITHHYIEKVM